MKLHFNIGLGDRTFTMLHLHLHNASVHSRMQTDPTQDEEHLVIIDK